MQVRQSAAQAGGAGRDAAQAGPCVINGGHLPAPALGAALGVNFSET
jgi:hypothetical protein